MKNIFGIYKKYLLLLILFCCSGMQAIERSITIIIPSFNNKKWYKRNLDSVFAQNYSNYRVIYVDDCSPDGTADLVAEYVAKKKQTDHFTLVPNQTRQLAMANIYRAVHSCDDNEIIVVLDGDDWWCTNQALSMINKAYEDSTTWMTYGRHITWPQNRLGWGKPLSKRRIERHDFRRGQYLDQQRTFYAWLFKQVKLEDLLCFEHEQYAGQFYPTNYDIAMMFPMIEMAARHFTFLPLRMYVYNVGTQFNDWKVHRKKMISFGRILRNKKPYASLENAPTKSHDAVKVELIKNDDLEAIQKIASSSADYILVSDSYVKDDCDKVIAALEQTHARAAFFDQANMNIPSVILDKGVQAWQWKWASATLGNPFKDRSFLVHRKYLLAAMKNKTPESQSEFYASLSSIFSEGKQVGLFVQ